MSISPARTIAFDVLRRVATQDAYADESLRAALDESVRPDDAGLATELTLGVLRWQRLLDFVIDRNLTKKTKTLDIEVRIALRMGFYQLHFLERVPAHAAVHESVELVKKARKRSAAPLVNAILRKAAKESIPRERRAMRSASCSHKIFRNQNRWEFSIRIPPGWSSAGCAHLEKSARERFSRRTIVSRLAPPTCLIHNIAKMP